MPANTGSLCYKVLQIRLAISSRQLCGLQVVTYNPRIIANLWKVRHVLSPTVPVGLETISFAMRNEPRGKTEDAGGMEEPKTSFVLRIAGLTLKLVYCTYMWEATLEKMSQGKRMLRALSRIGYPRADEFDLEGDDFEWWFDYEPLVPFLEWFCENIHESNVVSSGNLRK